MELSLSLVLIVIIYIACNTTDWKFNDYTPPKGYKIDNNKLLLDKGKNNLSNEQVMRNTLVGKYNVRR